MNGAEIVIRTAIKAGIEVCFANAGTTEIPMALALDSVTGMKGVLGLFEGVCTGAADGYGRVADKPALTLLHLGPGLANGVANLHNARRARTPLLNLIGEHATWHRAADAPLTMDIEHLASTVSGWYKTCESSKNLSQDTAEAIAATNYGQIATLILPNDLMWAGCDGGEIASQQFSFDPIDAASIDNAVRLLQNSHKTAIILGGRALREGGLKAASRIKAATVCDLFTDHLPAYLERGSSLPEVIRIPYFPQTSTKLLSQYEAVLIVGAREPVTFFGYAGFPSYLIAEGQKKLTVTTERQDAAEAMEHLAATLKAPRFPKIASQVTAKAARPSVPSGELTPANVCQTLAALQPENAIIVDEGLTTSNPYYDMAGGLPRHSFLTTVGGAIGYGIPCAVGAAIASPERRVINFQADGSAMYTVQALWTMAREGLNVTTLICNNKSYNILKVELSHAGVTSDGAGISSLIELDRPDIDWVKLAGGMGVPAVSVNNVARLARELRMALSEPGPHLIEMMVVPPIL